MARKTSGERAEAAREVCDETEAAREVYDEAEAARRVYDEAVAEAWARAFLEDAS